MDRSRMMLPIFIMILSMSGLSTASSNYAKQGKSTNYTEGLPQNAFVNGLNATLGAIPSGITLNKTIVYLDCSSDFMNITLNFKEKFYGVVYADYNRFREDHGRTCRINGNGELKKELILSLKGCGTIQSPARVFINNIVVRFHPGLEMDGDEVITVICRYPDPKVVIPPNAPGSLVVTPNTTPVLQPLRDFEVLLIICAIIFLALLLLGFGCSYYCLKKRNIKVVRKRPASTLGSEITKVSDPISMFDGLKIPRAHAAESSGSEELTESVRSEYLSEEGSGTSEEEYHSTYSDQACEISEGIIFSTLKEPSIPEFDIKTIVRANERPRSPASSRMSSDSELVLKAQEQYLTTILERTETNTLETLERVRRIESRKGPPPVHARIRIQNKPLSDHSELESESEFSQAPSEYYEDDIYLESKDTTNELLDQKNEFDVNIITKKKEFQFTEDDDSSMAFSEPESQYQRPPSTHHIWVQEPKVPHFQPPTNKTTTYRTNVENIDVTQIERDETHHTTTVGYDVHKTQPIPRPGRPERPDMPGQTTIHTTQTHRQEIYDSSQPQEPRKYDLPKRPTWDRPDASHPQDPRIYATPQKPDNDRYIIHKTHQIPRPEKPERPDMPTQTTFHTTQIHRQEVYDSSQTHESRKYDLLERPSRDRPDKSQPQDPGKYVTPQKPDSDRPHKYQPIDHRRVYSPERPQAEKPDTFKTLEPRTLDDFPDRLQRYKFEDQPQPTDPERYTRPGRDRPDLTRPSEHEGYGLPERPGRDTYEYDRFSITDIQGSERFNVLTRVLDPPEYSDTYDEISSIFTDDERIKIKEVILQDVKVKKLIETASTTDDFLHIKSQQNVQSLLEPQKWDVLIRILQNPNTFEDQYERESSRSGRTGVSNQELRSLSEVMVDFTAGDDLRSIPEESHQPRAPEFSDPNRPPPTLDIYNPRFLPRIGEGDRYVSMSTSSSSSGRVYSQSFSQGFPTIIERVEDPNRSTRQNQREDVQKSEYNFEYSYSKDDRANK